MADSPRKTILLVEDFDDIRLSISTVIELQGHRVIEATDGHEAVEMARMHLPDLILMDIAMPGFDGLTAAREIRSYPDFRNTKMVAVSAHPEFADEAIEAGFDEAIDKSRFMINIFDYLAKYLPDGSQCS